MLDSVQKDTYGKSADQVSFFGEMDDELSMQILDENQFEDFSPAEKYAYENELSGMYLSGNPMSEYLMHSALFSDVMIYSLNDGDIPEGKKVTICGILSKVNTSRTKNGTFICTMSFSDYFDTVEVTAFENTYNKYKNLLTEGTPLCITAQVKKRNEQVSLSLSAAVSIDSLSLPANPRLYLRLTDRLMVSEISPVLEGHKGQAQVCLYFEDTAQRLMTDSNHGVIICNELIEELIELIGGENVKIK